MVSCDDDDTMDGEDSTNDIVQVLQDNDFDALVAAATQAGLVETLQGDGPFTVFAPTDEAFAALLTALDVELAEISTDDLVEILTYHVVAAEVLSTDAASGDVQTVNGASIAVTVGVDGIQVNGASVVEPFDLLASNGVVHAIDEVLVPEGFELSPTDDIVALAVDNGFTSLAAALTRAGLVSALQADGPFTVFAPTDAAFADLLAAIGQESIDDVPVDVLANILKYHVVSGAVPSSAVTAGNVETLNGAEVTLATTGGITVNGANVISPFDVEATNGIIHTIDAVLVPDDVAQFVGTILQPAYFNTNFTTLVAAAVKAEVVTTILEADALTIFAPTNAVFEAAGITSLDGLSSAALADILTYHVVAGKVTSSQLPASATTLQGSGVWFSTESNQTFINTDSDTKAEITTVDIEAGSGVIHLIDGVLMPPAGNIVEIAVALKEASETDEFSSLIAALQRTTDEGTSEQDLIAVLSGDGPFTVFAPTNAAFQALLDSDASWNSLSDIPLATLIDVLTYHVVAARAYSVDLSGAVDVNNEITTVQGTNLAFDLANLTINTDVNITSMNTNATNGVIHVIDKVLVP